MLRYLLPSTNFDWNLLALATAGGLLHALLLLTLRPDLLVHGHRQVTADGCVAHTWRNPASGRDEALRGRLDGLGRPVCR